ncbi:MAG: hypothetical protein Q4P14_04735 [Methanobacteriaceae archaeon]|nr:hypothetical protein [Methanobacteriaceae archaeon]
MDEFEFDEFDDFEDFEDEFEDDWDFEDSDNSDNDNFEDFNGNFGDSSIDDDNLDDDWFGEKPLKADSGYEITAWEVHISEQLTSGTIIRLMNTYPSLKKITCPPSIYNRISKKYLDVLDQMGIIVEVKRNYGQKTKYTEDDINQVVDLLKSGKSPKEVAIELDLSIEKVHYLKSRYSEYFKLNNHKKKYDEKTREKIRQMRENGLKPKEIAKIENIPIRSIYYILNKK